MLRLAVLTALIISFFYHQALAQGWKWVNFSKGRYVEGVGSVLATDVKNDIYVYGGFAGDVILNGTSYNSGGQDQMIIQKYNTEGSLLWARNMVGQSVPVGIGADDNGNVYIAGFFDDTMRIGEYLFHQLSVGHEYFIAKYSPVGNLLWAKLVGTDAILTSLTVSHSGNVFVCGGFYARNINMDGYTLNNNGYYNILMSAYNTDGQIRWAKSFGGGSQDFSSDICVSSDNYIYLCGSYTSNTISFDTTKLTDPLHFNVAYIAKFSDDGRGIWAQNIYGAQNTSAYCITSDNSNNVFLAGFFDSTAVFGAGTLITTLYGYPSFFVAKYTSDGLVSWSREITSTVPGNLDLRDITSDKCGSLWVTGPMSDTTQVDNNIITAPDGSFDPMYIAKFDADGGANTVFTIPSGGYFWRSGIATDQQDDMYLTATFAGPSFELAGDTIYSLNGKGGNYLAKYGQSDINSSQPFHDTTICDQRIDFYIKVDFPPGGNVIWNNGSVIPLMHVRDTGTYWVRISNSINCNTTDTFHVSNAECGCGPVMPTGFTPNGDGKNDEFKPIISPECNITSYFMAVYNRWGQQIFFSQNLKHGWDGTFNGSNVEVGTYMYMIEYRNEKSNINRLKKGDITLIR